MNGLSIHRSDGRRNCGRSIIADNELRGGMTLIVDSVEAQIVACRFPALLHQQSIIRVRAINPLLNGTGWMPMLVSKLRAGTCEGNGVKGSGTNLAARGGPTRHAIKLVPRNSGSPSAKDSVCIVDR